MFGGRLVGADLALRPGEVGKGGGRERLDLFIEEPVFGLERACVFTSCLCAAPSSLARRLRPRAPSRGGGGGAAAVAGERSTARAPPSTSNYTLRPKRYDNPSLF